MKRLLLFLSLILLSAISWAQLPDAKRSTAKQVVSDVSVKVTKSLAVPNGNTPGFPAWVPDTSKKGSIYVQITPGQTDKLKIWDSNSSTWVDVSPDVSDFLRKSGGLQSTSANTIFNGTLAGNGSIVSFSPSLLRLNGARTTTNVSVGKYLDSISAGHLSVSANGDIFKDTVTYAPKADLSAYTPTTILTNTDRLKQYVFMGMSSSNVDQLNNSEVQVTKFNGDTLVRVAVLSTNRSEEDAGAYLAIGWSYNNGFTWSDYTTAYTPSGNTVLSPMIQVRNRRIIIPFGLLVNGGNDMTQTAMRSIYSDNMGSTWSTPATFTSPNGSALIPGSFIKLGDGQYHVLAHTEKFCEVWKTPDGVSWAYQGIVYDNRTVNPQALAQLDVRMAYIGGNKVIVTARNNKVPGSHHLQYISSDNLNTVTFAGFTNAGSNLKDTTVLNPLTIIADTVDRVLIGVSATRRYLTSKTRDSLFVTVSDADEVFANPKSYRTAFMHAVIVPNERTFFKGYSTIAKTSTGYTIQYNETTPYWKNPSGQNRVNMVYQLHMVNSTRPFDVKNLKRLYNNAPAVHNPYTNNIDHVYADQKVMRSADTTIHDDEFGSRVFRSAVNSSAEPVLRVQTYAGADVWRVLANGYMQFGLSARNFYFDPDAAIAHWNTANTNTAPYAMTRLGITTNGFGGILQLMSPGSGSLYFGQTWSGSNVVANTIVSTGAIPLSIGVSANNQVLNIFANQTVGENGSFTSPVTWHDFRASTTAFATMNIPVGADPTSPANGGIWRSFDNILRFRGASATYRFALQTDVTPSSGQQPVYDGNGNLVATTPTGTGAPVKATSPTLITPFVTGDMTWSDYTKGPLLSTADGKLVRLTITGSTGSRAVTLVELP